MSRLLLLNKPYDVLSQFTDKSTEGGARKTLSDFVKVPDVYPAGRLDRDSEGLLLLTDDGRLQAHIADPRHRMEKTYLVQVEGEVSQEALRALARGVTLKDGPTLPAKALRSDAPPWLWERTPPVRFRAAIPTSWVELTIREGRNRQVRRMTAHVGFPTLRLIRLRIGDWSLEGIESGDWQDGVLPAFGTPKAPKRGPRSAPKPDDALALRPSGKPSPHARSKTPKPFAKPDPAGKPATAKAKARRAGARPPLPNSPKRPKT